MGTVIVKQIALRGKYAIMFRGQKKGMQNLAPQPEQDIYSINGEKIQNPRSEIKYSNTFKKKRHQTIFEGVTECARWYHSVEDNYPTDLPQM